MEEKKDRQKEFSTCLEGFPFAETMQKMLGQHGTGSPCDEMMRSMTKRKKLYRRLDTAGWGLFFIWIGVAILADVGWGAGLIGVGLIILGGLAAREYL